jgi:hypothetical protein
MTPPQGPFLYDDDPAPLHTGTPRRRHGLIVALLGGTVLVAFLMVGATYWLKGTPEDQAREVAGVFLAALEQRDAETAHQLLCEAERARVPAEGVVVEYGSTGSGEITTVTEEEAPGGIVHEVGVEWSDGSESVLVIVGENGPRICGTG